MTARTRDWQDVQYSARIGDVAGIEQWLAQGPVPSGEQAAVLLRHAMSHGHQAAVAPLLLPFLQTSIPTDRTLDTAASLGHLDLVQSLLPHCPGHTSRRDAWVSAVAHGHLDIVKIIATHLSLNEQDLCSATAIAASNGHEPVLRHLLDQTQPMAAIRYLLDRFHQEPPISQGACIESFGLGLDRLSRELSEPEREELWQETRREPFELPSLEAWHERRQLHQNLDHPTREPVARSRV